MSTATVSVFPSVVVPKIETVPCGSLLVFTTKSVAKLVTVSRVPNPSVYCACNFIDFPTSACVSKNFDAFAFEISKSSRYQMKESSPIPSSSLILETAVSSMPSTGWPEILKSPTGASLTF